MNKVSDLHPEELAALLHLQLGEAREWLETAKLLASGVALDSALDHFRLSPTMHLLLPSIRHLMRVSVEELEWLVLSGELYRLYPYYESTHSPRAHIRWRQLEDLLSDENEFETRYPAAYEVLFGHRAISGLSLPSFDARVQRNEPHGNVLRAGRFTEYTESKDSSDAYSVTFHRREAGVDEIKRSYSPLDNGYLRGLLLSILLREEHAERVATGPHSHELTEEFSTAHSSSVRLTDLRLARDIGSIQLRRELGTMLDSLLRPISAKSVSQWKHAMLKLPRDEPNDNHPKETDDINGMTDDTNSDEKIMAVSFAAAALLLFLDLDMPRLSEINNDALSKKVVIIHDLINELDKKVNVAVDSLDKLLANRASGRKIQNLDSKYRDALVRYQWGETLESIAEWWGLTIYDSQKVAGTRDWKSKIIEYIRQGDKVEQERHPEVAAVLKRNEDPIIRERARRAFEVFNKHPGEFSGEDERLELAARSAGVDTSQDRWRCVTDAYGRLGACLYEHRPLLPQYPKR